MFDGKSIHYQQATIQNDGFWPDIDAGDFEKSRTIPAVTSHETVLTALLCAVTEINAELAARREYWQEQGYTTAADIPGYSVLRPAPRDTDTQVSRAQNHIAALYTKAVYARAKADLLPESASVGRRDAQPSQEASESRRTLLAESAMAVRALLGRPRASVALID
ncbi:head completion/stabilization protein [Citrobacter sp. TSA-1]|nr:head protein [Citrobacter sp. TSA-1]QKE22495.1 head completion/stabilization protein [Citrobacter sp. TSA-1]